MILEILKLIRSSLSDGKITWDEAMEIVVFILSLSIHEKK